jgi:transposase
LDSQFKEDGAAAMCGKYLSDVADRQWRILVKLLPRAAHRGRPPIDRRQGLNAMLYLIRPAVATASISHDSSFNR